MGFLDLFFPKLCVVCRKYGVYLCPSCFANLSFDTKKICLMCTKPSIDGLTHPLCRTRYAIDGAFCATAYNPTMKKLMFRFKYNPFISDLADFLTELFFESIIQQEAFASLLNKGLTNHQASPPTGKQKNIFCIPIPLSSKKLRRRGYNQSELIGKNISDKFGWKLVNCLIRTRDTKPQFGLTKKERIKNMKEAFAYRYSGEERIAKVAFVVDDLLTTGTTLREAASVLKRNGFEKVFGLCLAGDSSQA